MEEVIKKIVYKKDYIGMCPDCTQKKELVFCMNKTMYYKKRKLFKWLESLIKE